MFLGRGGEGCELGEGLGKWEERRTGGQEDRRKGGGKARDVNRKTVWGNGRRKGKGGGGGEYEEIWNREQQNRISRTVTETASLPPLPPGTPPGTN